MLLSELIEQLEKLREYGDFELVMRDGEDYSPVTLAPEIKAFETGSLKDGPVNELHYAEERLTYYVEI